jgi:hypothetical protein
MFCHMGDRVLVHHTCYGCKCAKSGPLTPPALVAGMCCCVVQVVAVPGCPAVLSYASHHRPMVQEFLADRYRMYADVYTCTATQAIEVMVVDALVAAEPDLGIKERACRWVWCWAWCLMPVQLPRCDGLPLDVSWLAGLPLKLQHPHASDNQDVILMLFIGTATSNCAHALPVHQHVTSNLTVCIACMQCAGVLEP